MERNRRRYIPPLLFCTFIFVYSITSSLAAASSPPHQPKSANASESLKNASREASSQPKSEGASHLHNSEGELRVHASTKLSGAHKKSAKRTTAATAKSRFKKPKAASNIPNSAEGDYQKLHLENDDDIYKKATEHASLIQDEDYDWGSDADWDEFVAKTDNKTEIFDMNVDEDVSMETVERYSPGRTSKATRKKEDISVETVKHHSQKRTSKAAHKKQDISVISAETVEHHSQERTSKAAHKKQDISVISAETFEHYSQKRTSKAARKKQDISVISVETVEHYSQERTPKASRKTGAKTTPASSSEDSVKEASNTNPWKLIRNPKKSKVTEIHLRGFDDSDSDYEDEPEATDEYENEDYSVHYDEDYKTEEDDDYSAETVEVYSGEDENNVVDYSVHEDKSQSVKSFKASDKASKKKPAVTSKRKMAMKKHKNWIKKQKKERFAAKQKHRSQSINGMRRRMGRTQPERRRTGEKDDRSRATRLGIRKKLDGRDYGRNAGKRVFFRKKKRFFSGARRRFPLKGKAKDNVRVNKQAPKPKKKVSFG